MTAKPRISTEAEMRQAMSALIEEFRAPPETSEELAEAMLGDWATTQLLERYDLAPGILADLMLATVAEAVRKEVEADPLAKRRNRSRRGSESEWTATTGPSSSSSASDKLPRHRSRSAYGVGRLSTPCDWPSVAPPATRGAQSKGRND